MPHVCAPSSNFLQFFLRFFFHLNRHLPPPNSALSRSHSSLTLIYLAMSTFIKSGFGAELGETLSQRSPTPDQPGHLFPDVKGDAFIANTATPSNAGTAGNNSFYRKIHSEDLRCREELYHLAVCLPTTYQQFQALSFLYHFITADYVSETLGSLLSSGFYAWQSKHCALYAACPVHIRHRLLALSHPKWFPLRAMRKKPLRCLSTPIRLGKR